METKQIFEDILSHLDSTDIIDKTYFNAEKARFKELMIQPSDVSNAIIAKSIISDLISTYYDERRQVDGKAKTGVHRSNMIAYNVAIASLIMICKDLEIYLPKYFIEDLKDRGEMFFTSLMESKTPQERKREKLDQEDGKPKPKRKKGGRQKQKFEDCIKSTVKDKAGLMAKLKELIGDKTAKDACPYIWAAMKAQVIDQPTQIQIKRLCPSVTKTAYMKQMEKTENKLQDTAVLHLVKDFKIFNEKLQINNFYRPK